ncbi:hypothetical protein [Pelagibaculum spongiae]|uniref:Uncharacterized protein n=1 Tax=Pelagibaculum spongiae TaxID=2080658 RepID=A0A2V1GVC4_9GAMM|nr:hypothetical protein [Pelagibaculum spongiae]PVZ69641.1 hypothetical protein DC094_10065 [Pelagibaculum spongiae]
MVSKKELEQIAKWGVFRIRKELSMLAKNVPSEYGTAMQKKDQTITQQYTLVSKLKKLALNYPIYEKPYSKQLSKLRKLELPLPHAMDSFNKFYTGESNLLDVYSKSFSDYGNCLHNWPKPYYGVCSDMVALAAFEINKKFIQGEGKAIQLYYLSINFLSQYNTVFSEHSVLLVSNEILPVWLGTSFDPTACVPEVFWRMKDAYICDPWMDNYWNVVEGSWHKNLEVPRRLDQLSRFKISNFTLEVTLNPLKLKGLQLHYF